MQILLKNTWDGVGASASDGVCMMWGCRGFQCGEIRRGKLNGRGITIIEQSDIV